MGPTTRRASAALDRRALNRALLARQLLLDRASIPVLDAIERVVGLQAQSPNPPYVGLWTRLADFDAAELSRLITDREVVRVALMRSTIHLVSARDCLMLRPLVQPVLAREFKGSAHGRNVAAVDLDQLVATGRALVEAGPLTTTELAARLHEQWPACNPRSLAFAIRNHIALVQVPPRGLWGKSGAPACTSVEQWLGRPLDATPSIDRLIVRYLAAFGPATVMDIQAWSGLTRLREPIDRLRPSLCTFRDDRGVELFDLPDAPRPDPDIAAPVRFLPEFDNVLLSHADRRRVIADDDRARIATLNGMVPGSVLVDGFFHGTWRLSRTRRTATLVIQPHTRLRRTDRIAVAEEGERLLEFVAAGTIDREVEIEAP